MPIKEKSITAEVRNRSAWEANLLKLRPNSTAAAGKEEGFQIRSEAWDRFLLYIKPWLYLKTSCIKPFLVLSEHGDSQENLLKQYLQKYQASILGKLKFSSSNNSIFQNLNHKIQLRRKSISLLADSNLQTWLAKMKWPRINKIFNCMGHFVFLSIGQQQSVLEDTAKPL